MLNPAAYPAQCFLADAQVGGDMAQWHSFQNMRRSLQQGFVSFGGAFEMSIHKSFFQADIIFFVSNSYQPLNFMIAVKKACQGVF